MQSKTFICIATVVVCIVSLLHTNGVKAQPSKGYYFENEKFITWPEAFEFCKNNNMTLVSIRDKEEFEFLKTIIEQKFKKVLPYWIGAYRIEGVFKWLPSGDTITYFMWHMDQPNNLSGHENCIHTWEQYFDWNDNDCSVPLPFICEVLEN